MRIETLIRMAFVGEQTPEANAKDNSQQAAPQPNGQAAPQPNEQVATRLDVERLKLIDEISRVILELKKQFPELAQSLEKARDNISVNIDTVSAKNLQTILNAIQQTLNKPELKELTPELKQEFKQELKPELRPEIKPELKPELKLELKPELKPEFRPEFKPELKPEFKPEFVEAVRNLVNQALKILQPSTEIPPENKLLLALSQNDFAKAEIAIRNIIETATTTPAATTPKAFQTAPQTFQIILNALQELKTLGIPKEFENTPLKELEAVVLQKTGIEIEKNLAKNLQTIFNEKPAYAVATEIPVPKNILQIILQAIPNSPMPPSPPANTQPPPANYNANNANLPPAPQTIPQNSQTISQSPQTVPQNIQAIPQKPEIAFSLYQIIAATRTPEPQPQTTNPIPLIQYPQSSTPNPTPSIQYLKSDTSNPIPQTQYPISHTPTNPIPQISSPTSQISNPQIQIPTPHSPLPTPNPTPQFILQIWPASIHIPREERDFWLKTELPLTPQIIELRNTILSFGKLPEDPQMVRLFAENLHEMSLKTENSVPITKEQANLLWRMIQLNNNSLPSSNFMPPTFGSPEQPASSENAPRQPVSSESTTQRPANFENTPQQPISSENTAKQPVSSESTAKHSASFENSPQQQVSLENTAKHPVSFTATPLKEGNFLPLNLPLNLNNSQFSILNSQLLKYQPLGNHEGEMLKTLPEAVRKEILQELPAGKTWQPEMLQKAVEKILEKHTMMPHSTANEEVRQVLQNMKEQIQWTRIDHDTRPPTERENVFYFMHNEELQKGRLKIKDERKGGNKKQHGSPISFSISTHTKALGDVHADLTLSKNVLNIRLQDSFGNAGEAIKEERETLAKELADIGISLGELLYGKTPKIKILPVSKTQEKSGLDLRA